MEKSVSIVLLKGERFDFHFSATDFVGLDAASARELIGDLCEEAGVEGQSRTGKVLLVDQILLYADEQRSDAWVNPSVDLRRFLAAALVALGRDGLTINLQERKL
jgi:hypothetical protein